MCKTLNQMKNCVYFNINYYEIYGLHKLYYQMAIQNFSIVQ